MKPIKLVMSAFGPYLNETVIDFSLLGDNGLYLITGDTGAGKSTIFEAISYALYGETVSGKERNAAMLRNKRADDNTDTYVALDFVAKGKQYHIYRSPKYKYNKRLKRGSKKNGEEQEYGEHGNKFEFICDGITYSKEKDGEAKIKEIIGINKENFKKIAMIAQGEFMSVIREDTKKRGDILNSVFNTGNYVTLTNRLGICTKEAKEKMEKIKNEITAAVQLLSCDTESEFYKETEEKKSLPIITYEEMDRIQELSAKLISKDEEQSHSLQLTVQQNKKKQAEVDQQLGKAKIRQQNENELKVKQEQRKILEEKLPYLNEKLQSAKENPEKAGKLESQAEVLRSKLSDYDKLEDLAGEQKACTTSEKKCRENLDKAKKEKAKNEELISTYKRRLSQLEGSEEKKVKLETDYDKLVEKGKSRKKLLDDCQKLKEYKEEADRAKNDYLDSKRNYENQEALFRRINSAFLDNQAGILAADLKENEPCPVCGSVHHPKLATKHENAPSKKQVDQESAKRDRLSKLMNEAATVAETKNNRVNDKESELVTSAREKLGEDIPVEELAGYLDINVKELRKQCSDIKFEIRKLKENIDEKTEKTKMVDQLQQRNEEINTAVLKLSSQAAANSEKLKSVEKNISELSAKLEFESQKEAERRISELTRNAKMLKQEYENSKSEFEEYQQKIRDLRSQEEVLHKQLSESEGYDLETLECEKIKYIEKEKRLVEKEKQISVRICNNRRVNEVLKSQKSRFKKADDTYKRCKGLYDTANGELPGKDKIKLDAFIQAAYLDRVLIRANSRMDKMTDGRYELIRYDSLNDKRKTVGLDISITDNESGKIRSVNTLSGGESFMAALALSLGMSDEIQSTSGGIHLDTMFIDEGFGSLDDKALEKAVEALNGISSGSCLIGIISHVRRLKEMISKRIIVTRDNASNTTAKVEI